MPTKQPRARTNFENPKEIVRGKVHRSPVIGDCADWNNGGSIKERVISQGNQCHRKNRDLAKENQDAGFSEKKNVGIGGISLKIQCLSRP